MTFPPIGKEPQMSEGMKADEAEIETRRLQHYLDITNADHIALWLEANTILDEPMNQCISRLACRIVEAHEAARAPAPSSSPDVAALRKLVPFLEAHHVDASAVVDAADAIEQMQRRVEAMREALEKIADVVVTDNYARDMHVPAIEGLRNIARAALGDGAV